MKIKRVLISALSILFYSQFSYAAATKPADDNTKTTNSTSQTEITTQTEPTTTTTQTDTTSSTVTATTQVDTTTETVISNPIDRSLLTNQPGEITLTFAGGSYRFAHKRQLNNTSIPFLGLAYNFDSNWATELSWISFDTIQKATGQGVVGNLFMLDGIYRFQSTKCHFQPYVIAGIGNLGLKTGRSHSTQQGDVNAGLGVQWFGDYFLAFRGEVRDVYTTTTGTNDWMALLGINFLWG